MSFQDFRNSASLTRRRMNRVQGEAEVESPFIPWRFFSFDKIC